MAFQILVVLTLIAGSISVSAKEIHLRAGSFETNVMNGAQALAVGKTIQTDYYIIQFTDPLNLTHSQLLEDVGVEVIRYIPDDAFLVKAQAHKILELEISGEVSGVVPYLGSFKVSLEFPAVTLENKSKVVDVIVQLASEKEQSQVLDQLSNYTVVVADGKIILVKAKLGEISNIALINGVEWIQPQSKMSLMHIDLKNDFLGDSVQPMSGNYTDLSGFESGVKIMNFSKAWERGFKGEGQKVAMADTGLDSGTKDSLTGDFLGVYDGQALGLFAKTWEDPMGHGTHVAGSVVGKGADSKGMITGGAIEGEMLAQGMWSPVFKNLTIPPQLKTLFQKAYDRGARIHTNSWGAPFNLGVYDKNAMLVDEFMWNHPDMLVIFAAGNSGQDEDRDGRVDEGSVSSPGTAKNALTVGASENLVSVGGIQRTHGKLRGGDEKWGVPPLRDDTLSNNENGMAVFSSRGPARDGRIKPEVVAPGTNILSNCSHIKDSSPLWGNYNTEYCWSGGTSMSTPLTAGAAAVARGFLAKSFNLESPSAALVKGLLMHTATDLFPGQYGFRSQGQEMLEPAPNNQEGFGRVNMDSVTDRSPLLLVVDSVKGVRSGETLEFAVDTQGAKEVTITLVYTDAPGSPSAAKTLVNDLNISAENNGASKESTSDVNNFENLKLSELVGSSLKVKITGTRIAQGKEGKQPFALLVSGK